MDENLHDIDKLFRDPIEAHEEAPSTKVWDAIDNNLDKSNVVSIKKKYNNLKKLAVALLLLLLGAIVYEVQTNKSSAGKDVATTKIIDGDKITADKQTKQSAGQNKVNVKDTSGTGSVNSNNYTTNNAVNNNDKNSTLGADVKNNDKRVVTPVSQNAVSVKSSNTKNNKNIADDAVQPDENEKSPVKKSSKQKTKIALRNATADELPDVNSKPSKVNGKKGNAIVLNVLTQPDRTTAEKIIFEKQNIALKINPNRITPDAALKNSLAKNKTAKAAKPFHFSVTPFFSPQFSSNRIEDDRHDGGPQPRNGREAIKKDEQHQTSSTFGILVDIPVGKKWSLQSGINYVNKNIEIEPKKIFAKLDNDGKVKYRFDCSSGYKYLLPKTGTAPIVGDSINTSASTNNLQYLGIPLAINYNFSFKKFNIIPIVGTVANFLVKQKIETELIQGTTKEKQTINTIQGLKPVYFNAVTGIAFEYNLSKRIALSIMPSGNFALSAINKDAAVKSYPNSFGLSGGVKIKF